MKAIFSLIISGALVVSGFGQTRNVLVGTNNAVVQPTNFWSADASNARTGLGLGTAATNPATAFQPSSSALTNLSIGNGGALTNLSATSIVGQIPSTNLPSTSFTNILETLSIGQGGTGATNAANARQNLGSTTVGDAVFIATNGETARTAIGATTVGSSLFTLANPSAVTFLRLNADNTVSALSASDYRTALSLGTAATNPATAFQPASTVLSNLASSNGANLTNISVAGVVGALATNGNGAGLTNLTAANITGAVGLASNVTGTIAISNGGSGATTAGEARTNIGLSFAALTNTNTSGFNSSLYGAGTNPVLYNTNGEVVSPTNFWQVSPANTRVQISQPVVNATNTATNARNLYFYSLAISTTGVTNTIQLPTNGGTLLGDVATVIHEGPTSSVTAVRQIDSGTNLITLNQFQEAVKFIYESSGWRLADNISYVEPIYFSGTNAAANAAASRTNLGLGSTNNVEFQQIKADSIILPKTGAPLASIQTSGGSLSVSLGGIAVSPSPQTVSIQGGYKLELSSGASLSFAGGNSISNAPAINFADTTNAATTRTNLGLPLAALTNTSNADFRTAIELGATNNVTFSNVTASGTLTSTGVVTALSNAAIGGTLTATGSVTALSNVAVTGTLTATSTVTAKTNLVVEGFVDFSTNHTNSNPATNNQINDFIEIRVGTNQFWLPVYK